MRSAERWDWVAIIGNKNGQVINCAPRFVSPLPPVLYRTVMAAWLAVVVIDSDGYIGWGSAGFMGTALVGVLGWQLLRYRRKAAGRS